MLVIIAASNLVELAVNAPLVDYARHKFGVTFYNKARDPPLLLENAIALFEKCSFTVASTSLDGSQ